MRLCTALGPTSSCALPLLGRQTDIATLGGESAGRKTKSVFGTCERPYGSLTYSLMCLTQGGGSDARTAIPTRYGTAMRFSPISLSVRGMNEAYNDCCSPSASSVGLCIFTFVGASDDGTAFVGKRAAEQQHFSMHSANGKG